MKPQKEYSKTQNQISLMKVKSTFKNKYRKETYNHESKQNG